jgi:thiamine biosynthesis lipoprotein
VAAAGLRRRLSLAVLAVVPALVYEPTQSTVERRVASMGTTVDLVVRMRYREQALDASEAAIRELSRIESLLTTWKRGGELDRIDEAPPGQPVSVSHELVDLLGDLFAWIPRTDGAFDPTIAPLMRAWDLRGKGRIPTPAELAAARAAVGADQFRLDPAQATVTRRDTAAGIDEGAWGKGYGLDRAAAALTKAGVRSALLDLGGQVLAIGDDAGERPWRVPVADPRDRGRIVVELRLSGGSASTSGDSERSRVVEGRKIGHLLDPKTGEPAPDFGSATVVAPTGFVADVLSTAMFVLGPERGLALSERLRREGVEQEVLFLVVRGDRLEASASPGFSSLVLSADPRVVVGLTTSTP